MFNIRLPRILIAALLILLGSCGDTSIFVDCSKCYSPKPTLADITLLFTINDENTTVNFTVYSGTYESGTPIYYGQTAQSQQTLTFEVDCYYTVVAEYHSGGRCIMAVDGKMLKTEYNNDDCHSECYLIVGDEFDVRLKYGN